MQITSQSKNCMGKETPPPSLWNTCSACCHSSTWPTPAPTHDHPLLLGIRCCPLSAMVPSVSYISSILLPIGSFPSVCKYAVISLTLKKSNKNTIEPQNTNKNTLPLTSQLLLAAVLSSIPLYSHTLWLVYSHCLLFFPPIPPEPTIIRLTSPLLYQNWSCQVASDLHVTKARGHFQCSSHWTTCRHWRQFMVPLFWKSLLH